MQDFVGGVHVREERVAPHIRDLDCPQDRGLGGTLAPGDVVVPLVLVAGAVGVLLEAHQLRLLGVRGDERVDLEFAEVAGEGHVLGRRERLPAEEDHLVVGHCGGDLVDGGRWKVTCQVDA